MNQNPIYVVLEKGLVTEIKNIPAGFEIQVIDKDVECDDPKQLSISPLDGEACFISRYPGHETE